MENENTEVTPTFLEQVKSEREALEKVRDEIKVETAKMQELRAIEMLSGKSEAGKQVEKPKEQTPQEYAKEILGGK